MMPGRQGRTQDEQGGNGTQGHQEDTSRTPGHRDTFSAITHRD